MRAQNLNAYTKRVAHTKLESHPASCAHITALVIAPNVVVANIAQAPISCTRKGIGFGGSAESVPCTGKGGSSAAEQLAGHAAVCLGRAHLRPRCSVLCCLARPAGRVRRPGQGTLFQGRPANSGTAGQTPLSNLRAGSKECTSVALRAPATVQQWRSMNRLVKGRWQQPLFVTHVAFALDALLICC